MDSAHSPTTKPIFRVTQIIWYLLGIVEVLLVLRFLLKLFGANSGAWFTNLIYVASQPLVTPFTAVFGTNRVQASVFEWTTLLAIAVYAILAWGVAQLLMIGKTVSTPEAARKLM